MLDRMGLSVRSGWLDSEGRVYIYFTLEDALAMLGCGKDKAVRLFKELDVTGGIGLIERRKQGQGRPARIYVKNFTLPPDPEEDTPAPASEGQRAQTAEKLPQLRLIRIRLNGVILRHLSIPLPPRRLCTAVRGTDRIEKMDSYRALIYENICYGDLLREHPYDADLIDGYVEMMVEICCTRRETVRVNQEDIPTQVVRSRFLKLNREHILYAMESMQRNTAQVGNIRAYTLSALYNAPVTISPYYVAQVSHDMVQDWGVSI